MIAIKVSERKFSLIKSWSKNPKKNMGIEPIIISQPILFSDFSMTLKSFLRKIEKLNQLFIIETISFRKKIRTASSVPICVIAVKAAPGSLALGKNSPTILKCALEEIGKNSVRPWTKPRNTASKNLVMVKRFWFFVFSNKTDNRNN